MSPRPPPKISRRHDWTKESGSKVDRQPEGEVVRQPGGEVAQQAKFFQPTQPIPNPIRDRSGRPGITQDVIGVQDERKTSRSQEISVNSFHEELCSSDRSGRSGITQDVISAQTRSSEDSKSLNVEQTHDRTGRPVTDTAAAQDDPEVYHEAETLNINDETIRERIEADMDFKITRLTHSIVKHARHALQQDPRQNQSFNPFSPESKQMIRDVGNIELFELLETEPKAQCKVCLSYWDIGIVYCTCGHFLRKGRAENQTFIKYTMDLLSIPDYVFKKGRPHGHRYGKKPGDKEYYIDQLKKKCKKKCFQGIHDRFIRDEQFRNRMIENDRDEDLCRQMDALADEGGFVRTRQVPMPVQRRSDFKQALSTLQKLKEKEEGARRNQQWAQSSSSSSWWSWQGSWWTPYSYESHHGDEPRTD